MEIWKDVVGYEGYYQVSDMGRVKALAREIQDTTKNRVQRLKEHILIPQDNGSGYKVVCLCKRTKRKNHYIHRLVAEAFIPNSKKLKEVNHINFNKEDNNIDNLEWVTSRENKIHLLNDTRGKEKCKKSGETRFKNVVGGREESIINDYVLNNMTIKNIAKKNCLNPATVTKVLKRNNVELNPNKKCYREHIKRGRRGRFIDEQ